jgi:hypothetical protein
MTIFITLSVLLWTRLHGDFPSLALWYLWLAPFLPLVSLLNHNLDEDRYGSFVRLLPIYVVLALLFLSLYEWCRYRSKLQMGVEELFLALYILISLLQIPLSVDPVWALCAWSWSVPGYLLFLIAGRATRIEDLLKNRYALWTVVGFIGINIGLIVYGLMTERTDNLFYTRNFGSIYASTAMLAFLVLYSGVAWLVVRPSILWSYVFFITSAVAIGLSLSRTALLAVAVYIAHVLTPSRRFPKRGIIAVTLVIFTFGVSIIIIGQYFDLNTLMFSSWAQRFDDGSVLQAFTDAREYRVSLFDDIREQLTNENPVLGKGFAMFHEYSIYTDAHDLFVTEAFENSLIGAVSLFFAFGIPRAFWALTNYQLRPLAVSILGFLFLLQLTGGMLSYRAFDMYYSAYPGWMLFFLIGCLANAFRRSKESAKEAIHPNGLVVAQ